MHLAEQEPAKNGLHVDRSIEEEKISTKLEGTTTQHKM